MSVYVFVGPSLGKRDNSPGSIIYLPPIQRGDVLALLVKQPDAIGIIDGAFYQSPSVLHKEIIEAIGTGIPVFGGSSMGALRAAELERFGMQGVGQIFHWYKDGTLIDDDAVGLTHGPAELGYPVLTVPLVDILATTRDLVARGLISEQVAAIVLGAARSVHFSERSWEWFNKEVPALVGNGAYQVITTNWINQKQRDAHELLDKIVSKDAKLRPFPRNIPLTTWLSKYYYCHSQIDCGLPLLVFSAFTQIVAETFPSIYARTVEDQFLASFCVEEGGKEDGWEVPPMAIAALTRRLGLIRRRADLTLSRYAARWRGATRQDAIGAALTGSRNRIGGNFLSQPPQRIPEHGRHLRNRAGDRSNLLAVVAFLSEPEAQRITDLARHSVRLRQKADRAFSVPLKPNPNDAIRAWCRRFGDRPFNELPEFCDARGLSVADFVRASAIVEEYETAIIRARRAICLR